VLLPRAYYSASIAVFLGSTPETVLGTLTANSQMAVDPPQRDAWLHEIAILKDSLQGLDGTLFLEFNIPRMGKRIDAVVAAGAMVFVIEFKVGEKHFTRADLDQVWDYALDLKNFHEASHAVPILPILVATEAHASDGNLPPAHDDQVYPPVQSNRQGLRSLIDMGLRQADGAPLDGVQWGAASYHPTPTIIEAAQSLYAQHSVDAIARHDAGARNLRVTSTRIEELVEQARGSGSKIICFVTGVPGAGKTLVGLNVATKRRDTTRPTHAVFLSGNGPLVAVLREALTRDEVARKKSGGLHALVPRRERVGVRQGGAGLRDRWRTGSLRETGAALPHCTHPGPGTGQGLDSATRAGNRALRDGRFIRGAAAQTACD
jgi:hypothetical protein